MLRSLSSLKATKPSRTSSTKASSSRSPGKRASVKILSAKLKRCALYCTSDPKRVDKTRVNVKEATWGIEYEVVIVDPSRRSKTTMEPRVIPTGLVVVLPLCAMHVRRMRQSDYWPGGPRLVAFDLTSQKAILDDVAKRWRVKTWENTDWTLLIDARTKGLADPLKGEGVTIAQL